MILMIDNYDSFTYNLVQYIGELGIEVKVARNDELTIADYSRNESSSHRCVAWSMYTK